VEARLGQKYLDEGKSMKTATVLFDKLPPEFLGPFTALSKALAPVCLGRPAK
jgi:hypothetical protein